MLDKLHQLATALEAFLFVYSAEGRPPGRAEGTHAGHSTVTEKKITTFIIVRVQIRGRSEDNLKEWVLETEKESSDLVAITFGLRASPLLFYLCVYHCPQHIPMNHGSSCVLFSHLRPLLCTGAGMGVAEQQKPRGADSRHPLRASPQSPQKHQLPCSPQS